MEIPVILSSGQETESFGAIALSFSAALCLFSQGYLNEKQIFAVAVVTEISLSSSGPCIDGFGFLLFVCVCELVPLQCSGCYIRLTSGRSLNLNQVEIDIPVNTELSPLK